MSNFALGLPVTVFAIRLFVFFRSARYPRRPFASARAEIGRRFLGGCKNRIFVKSSAMIWKTGRETAESAKFFVTAPFHRECPHVSALTPSRLGALKIKAFCAVLRSESAFVIANNMRARAAVATTPTRGVYSKTRELVLRWGRTTSIRCVCRHPVVCRSRSRPRTLSHLLNYSFRFLSRARFAFCPVEPLADEPRSYSFPRRRSLSFRSATVRMSSRAPSLTSTSRRRA